MSEPVQSDAGLQFDRAEFANEGPPCASCKRPLAGSYWLANEHKVCEACSMKLGDALKTKENAAILAPLFGAGAALAGAALWWAVETFLHLRIGLVAIAIGWMVGKSVRYAVGARSGVGYQLLAVALTYASIAASNVPAILQALGDRGLGTSDIALLALEAPVRFAASPISLLIIGFGLWEAWKFTRPATLNINGPFTLPRPAAPAASTEPNV